MTARIVLVGATGYTGARVARAMVARGAAPVLAGRDAEKLAKVAAELGGLETAAVDVSDRASLTALVRSDDVVVSTVGPFHTLGRGVIETVVEAGAVYLDSTGESPFIRTVFERWDALARRSGARLLTAFGCDWVPGNLAGALALEAAAGRPAGPPAETLHVGYFVSGASRGSVSRGTASSLFEIGLEPSYRFDRRRVSTERAAARLRRFDVGGEQRRAITVGGSEQFTLPRLSEQLRSVDVYLGWLGAGSAAAHVLSPVTDALGRVPGATGAWSKLGRRLTAGLPDGPPMDAARAVSTQTIAETFDRYGTRLSRVRVDGPEPYGMTADLLAWGAMRAASDGVDGTGALGPVDAFGLDALRDGARSAGLVVVEE